ncbi:MAG: NAD(P)/FAD-dependent oxidoreductase [Betaproteobacteria bacterium]
MAVAELRRADVIVIGGGIHGCSTALHLARLGLSALLLEKDHVGRHASGVNAGGVRRLGRHLAEVPLSVASMQIWHEIASLVDDDCGFTSHGQIKVAENDAELESLRQRVARVTALGFTHEELIGRDELHALLPAVAEHCVGGIVCRDDGAALPYRTTLAFARKAVALGAQLREGVRVRSLRRKDGLWQVATSDGEYQAPAVVNAAGAWAGELAAALGEPVPLKAVAPMLMITERVPHFIDPVVGAAGRTLSFKQFDNGTVMIGGGLQGTAYPERNETVLDFGLLAVNARTVHDLFPIMRGVQVVRAWAGIEARMPDDIPVIGPSRTHEGLWHSFGYSAHGFQMGPIVGRIIAGLVAGQGTSFDLRPFDIARFGATH